MMTINKRKPYGYWNNPDNLDKEIRLFIDKHGVEKFDANNMRCLGYKALNQVITRNGGILKCRQRLNLSHAPYQYRDLSTPEDVRKWISIYIEKHGVNQFKAKRMHELDPTLYRSIRRLGGWSYFERMLITDQTVAQKHSINHFKGEQPMTKLKQSDSDTAEYLQELADEGHDLHHGITHLLEDFTLPPLQQQALTEAAEQLGRVIKTIEGTK